MKMLPYTFAILVLVAGLFLVRASPVDLGSSGGSWQASGGGYPPHRTAEEVAPLSPVFETHVELAHDQRNFHPAPIYRWPSTEPALSRVGTQQEAHDPILTDPWLDGPTVPSMPASVSQLEYPMHQAPTWLHSPSLHSNVVYLDLLKRFPQQDSSLGRQAAHPGVYSTHINASPQAPSMSRDKPSSSKSSKEWTEELKRAWIKRRSAFKPFGGPKYLRTAEHIFPSEHWKKHAKLAVWENDKLRDVINSNVFNGKFEWVNLRDLSEMRGTLTRKSPVIQPSQKLPFIAIPADSLPHAEGVGGSYRVHFTDHGYTGRIRETQTVGSVLEGQAYLGIWAMPEHLPDIDYPLYFLGMGYVPPERRALVDRFLRALDAATKGRA